MTRRVTLRPQARVDLLDQFVYFEEKSDVGLAERYLAAIEETCRLLAAQPKSGVPYESDAGGLAGLRRFPVKGFDNYLVFYLTRTGKIEIVRVLHGAREITRLLANEED